MKFYKNLHDTLRKKSENINILLQNQNKNKSVHMYIDQAYLFNKTGNKRHFNILNFVNPKR